MMSHAEITWSLMHPTHYDVDYMKRIAEKAMMYHPDSFEICGPFAHPAGGLNGLLLLEPYPKAAALRDREMVMRTRNKLSEIIRICKECKAPLYLWHREIMMPDGMLDDRPDLLDPDGEFDLLGKDFEEFLRYKIDNAFKVLPDLAGVVLTLTEADYSVIHNSNQDRYPPDKVVEKIVRIFAEEHEKRGKRFILRSFGSIAADYEDILRGAGKAAKDHHFDIETKITPYDFDPFLPTNPFLKNIEGTDLNAECDCLGEYLGAGYLPAANVENIVRYINDGKAAGVIRYAIRLDRIGNCIFDSHEINLFAYHKLIRGKAGMTSDEIYSEYASTHWKGCESGMIKLARLGFECVKKTNFIAGNVMFHKFPIVADFRWIAAGGVLACYKDNADLHQLRGCWGILSGNRTPGRVEILKEKAEAVKIASEGLEEARRLGGGLSKEEAGKVIRVWKISNVVAPALESFSECLAAYFDDMEKHSEEPLKLIEAVAKAEKRLTSFMSDPSEKMPTTLSCCDGAPLPHDDLDRVYFKPLRALCRELIIQYRSEFALRKRFDDGLTRDLVLPGTFGDQYRVYRYMHASHSLIENGVPVRYAGNPVFPNGFIEMEMTGPRNGKIEISVLPGIAFISVSIDGESRIIPLPRDGKIELPLAGQEKFKLRIEKSGKDYPGIISVRTLG